MTDLKTTLSDILGAGGLNDEVSALSDAAHDIYRDHATFHLIAMPASTDALVACVRACATSRTPIYLRGGGTSYTSAYVPLFQGGVLIDTEKLNTILDIDLVAMTVTVEPGVTWAQLHTALTPLGVRTPFWGTYSGLTASIGGSLSQHAISLGTALWETSAQSVISVTIVDGQGKIFSTNRANQAFFRTFGPDVTGLFLGDCGTLGVKTEITLKLLKTPSHVAAVSFAFPDFVLMREACQSVAQRALASDILGLDPEIQKGFLGAMTTKSVVAASRAIFSTTRNPISAAIALFRAMFATRDYSRNGDFVAHFTVEGWSQGEVNAKATVIRRLVGGSGAEISNAAPLALRGNPFLPLTPVAPLKGGRWLPTHGVFSYRDIDAFHQAFQEWTRANQPAFDAIGLTMTRMFVPIGVQGFVYEPTFYWPDSTTPAQSRLAPADHLARVRKFDANETARAQIFAWRAQLVALMAQHGAQHFQIGKYYPYRTHQSAGTLSILDSLKANLDPDCILNPGGLGFTAAA